MIPNGENPWMQQQQQRTQKAQHEKVTVRSFSQLKKLIELYKTDDTAKPITVKADGETITVPNSSESMTLRLLVDGFVQLANQAVLMDAGQVDKDNEEYGGIYPASIQQERPVHHHLDRFISTHFDGRREGNRIVWDLPEGKFELDPWTLTLSKSSTQ